MGHVRLATMKLSEQLSYWAGYECGVLRTGDTSTGLHVDACTIVQTVTTAVLGGIQERGGALMYGGKIVKFLRLVPRAPTPSLSASAQGVPHVGTITGKDIRLLENGLVHFRTDAKD